MYQLELSTWSIWRWWKSKKNRAWGFSQSGASHCNPRLLPFNSTQVRNKTSMYRSLYLGFTVSYVAEPNPRYKYQWNTQSGKNAIVLARFIVIKSQVKYSFRVSLYMKKLLTQWTCPLNKEHQRLSAWCRLKIKLFWQTEIYCPTVCKGGI